MRHDLVGMTGEICQQVKLFWCEPHLFAAHQDLVAWKINLEISDADFLFLRFGRREAPKVSSYSRQQFIHAERFGDIIVRASVERFDLGTLLTSDGKNDDGNFGFRPYFSRELDTAHIRHRKVGNDQLRRPVIDYIESSHGVVGNTDL